MNPDRRELEGWKNIAKYLDVTPRAAQRWRRERMLPVHSYGGRIYAVRAEIDEWLRQNDSAFQEILNGAAKDGHVEDAPEETGLAEDAPREPEIRDPDPDLTPPVSRGRVRRTWIAIAASVILLLAVAGAWLLRTEGRIFSPPAVPFAVDRLFAAVAAEGGRLQSVSVGASPIRVIVHPTRPEIYVLNIGSGTVSVIDAVRLAVSRSLRIGWQPADLALDPAGRYLYVATHGDGLVRIDVETGEQTVFREELANGHILALALTADGKRLFLAMGHGGLRVMDLRSARVRTISSIPCPYSLAIAPEGSYLYVEYQCGGPGGTRGHDTVELFDLATEKPMRSLNGVPMVAGSLAAAPGDLSLWASGSDACTRYYAGVDQSGCPVNPGWVYHVFRPHDGLKVASLGFPMDQLLARAVFLPESGKVLVLGAESRVYDSVSLTEVERYTLAGLKYWADAAVDPVRRRLFAADEAGGTVHVVDLPSSPCAPPSRGLWAHWPMDGNLNGRVGGLHAEPSAGIRFAPGMAGTAANLTAGGLAIRGASEIHLSLFNTAPGTLAFWVKPLEARGEIARYQTKHRLFGWTLSRTPSGSLRFVMDGVAPLESRPIPGDRWSQVALARTPERIDLLVDGHIEAFATAPRPPRLGTDERVLKFGPFAGLVDEIVSYGRELSPQGLQTLDKVMRACVAPSK